MKPEETDALRKLQWGHMWNISSLKVNRQALTIPQRQPC